VTAAIGALWLAELAWTHSRDPRVCGHGGEEFTRVASATWRTLAIVAIIGFLTHWSISRGYLLMALPAGMVTLFVYRYLWRLRIHRQRDAGYLYAQVLVVGGSRTAAEVVRGLHRATHSGYHVVGVCLPQDHRGEVPDEISGVPVLGPIADALAQARSVGADFILLAGNNALSHAEVRKLGWSLEGTGVGLIVAPTMLDVAGPRVRMTPIEGLPLLFVDTPRFSGAKYVVKLAVDRLSSLAALAVLALPMLLVATLIRVTSPGPALFRQERVGLNYRPFTMLKFRTMSRDAERQLTTLFPQNEGHGPMFKMKDDPRITPIGRLLRRFSLDELPQLINVARGEMSLIGPRPPLPREVAEWDERVGRRQLVRPGITGLWQVGGRSDLSWEESVRLDLYYIENWTPGGDFIIIVQTLVAVLRRRGAY
jgi:exopolysaccharide biosynthesis polyprenyl glycosylphosphotransferase